MMEKENSIQNEAQGRSAWFSNAGLGLFIHWGLYSRLGGIWNGQYYPYGTEWIMHNARIPVKEYRKLANGFYPDHFDAQKWVRKAKAYGAKYLCITAKHHDGFAMYDSKVSDYNIMHTPFGRDIVRELSEECHKQGLVFCIYYSQKQDWDDPDGSGNDWDFEKDKKDFRRYFNQKAKPQIQELLTGYGDVGMIWFDTPYDMPVDMCEELREFVHSLQPNCLINGRIGYGLGDYREMSDNDIPVLSYKGAWETPMSLNNTWGYSKIDESWKSPKTVVRMLVDVVGRGGNLLLNIGPDGKGEIPKGSDEVMSALGQWLEKNGASIYGARPCIDFPYQMRWGGLTLRDNILYLHVLNTEENPDEIRICNLETKVKKVYLLESGEELDFAQSYEIARDEYRFRVTVTDKIKNPLDTVIAAELTGEPVVHSLYMKQGYYKA